MRWTEQELERYRLRGLSAQADVDQVVAAAAGKLRRHPERREEAHQVAYFEWACLVRLRTGERLNQFLTCVPNGGYRTTFEAARFKVAGVKAGFPDIECVLACGAYHGLHIEMKQGRNQPTADQLEWHARLRACGRKVVICWTWNEAARETIKYIGADPQYGPITEYAL